MQWVALVLAVLIVYGAAVRRTAEAAGVVALAFVVIAGGVSGFLGWRVRDVVGSLLLAAGLAAVAWALGRWRRRVLAKRNALAAFLAGVEAVPATAAAVERLRLAGELHDTAAHRLTGIVVGAASALRLGDARLVASALEHAAAEGRLVVRELAALTNGVPGVPRLADVDTLAGPGVVYRRTVDEAPERVAAVAYRVVREALTNAARYAPGAQVRVELAATDGDLTVTVINQAGEGGRAEDGLGAGKGLAGLRAAVAGCGGTLTAGPQGDGWAVVASFRMTTRGRERKDGWRGRRGADWALAALAVGLSVGTSLLDSDPVDLLLLLPLCALHALPLGWRGRAPGFALAVALSIYPVLVATRTVPPAGDVFLWCSWVELALLYAVGLSGKGLIACLGMAAVGGLALAAGPGITGDRLGAWVVLGLGVAVPAVTAWALGATVATIRARRSAGEARARTATGELTAAAVRTERDRIAGGLRRTAMRHAEAVVAAADAGRLADALAEARGGLTTLRDLLEELGETGDPAPTLAGVAALASRKGAVVKFTGERREVDPAVQVAAFRAAERFFEHGDEVTVAYLNGGVSIEGRATAGLRDLADAVGGELITMADGTIRVWLPE
ncbi:sensor histidine kinase [Streptosporangium vulgare]|uniref:histidine kinase n=1 Tax=Streptosporangium vulgare TaxID=46190 RepID=A0ABV5T6R8_9ACTN